MIGSPTQCAGCGKLLRSCVIPAYCWNCNPDTKQFRELLKEGVQKLMAEKAMGEADAPVVREGNSGG